MIEEKTINSPNSTNSSQEDKAEFREYNYKYFIVASFFIYALANTAYLVTLAPIAEMAATTYDVSTS